MFEQFKNLFKSALYIKISENLVSIKDIGTGEWYEDRPLLAIHKHDGKRKILAIGRAAGQFKSQAEVSIVNAFSHPRTLIADFELAEKILQHLIHKLHKNKYFKPAPKVILHPLDKLQGGLTDVEIRALMEMTLSAGAREVVVWHGQALTTAELTSQHYPASKGILYDKHKMG